MQQSSRNPFIDPQSWQHFLGEPPESKQSITDIIDVSTPKSITPMNKNPGFMDIEHKHEKQAMKSPSETLELDEPDRPQEFFKRIYNENLPEDEDQHSSQDKEPENTFKRQQPKASQYSRKHREKKKEKVKKLEEENEFLKKKVDELQVRLREKQLELNRIKFSLTQEEWTIQQMNEEMMKKLTLISDVTLGQNSTIKEQIKNQETEHEKKIKQWLKFYEDHGFGGRKKKQVLEYYINQFLQNVMRDREKYLIVNCVKKKYISQLTTLFDEQIAQALMNNTEENRQKSIMFNDFIRPACLELVEACRDFYASYRKVLRKIENIHNDTKILSMKNIEETLKRSRGAAWFQVNQYRKQMRNLRAEWIDLVKSEFEFEIPEDKVKVKRVSKRKKTTDD